MGGSCAEDLSYLQRREPSGSLVAQHGRLFTVPNLSKTHLTRDLRKQHLCIVNLLQHLSSVWQSYMMALMIEGAAC